MANSTKKWIMVNHKGIISNLHTNDESVIYYVDSRAWYIVEVLRITIIYYSFS